MTPHAIARDGARELAADRPRTAAELSAIVRDAAASRAGLRIAGNGSWLDAGHPVRATRTVSLQALRGITAYNPADLTLSCGAGTTLLELDEATHAHGQWCPLAPPGDDRVSTVGATVATAMEGPCAASLGRPRSLVLGLECVDGTGRIIAAGGRVVKNVAGFDLTRAMIGAWGTLGAITQVHLRLRARPVVQECWALRPPRGDGAGATGGATLRAYLRGPLAPLACVPLATTGSLAESDDRSSQAEPDHGYLVVLGGNMAFVDASRAALHALGPATPQPEHALDAWRAMQDPPARALAWRWDPLSLRLRERFDPHGIMNPGLLGAPA